VSFAQADAAEDGQNAGAATETVKVKLRQSHVIEPPWPVKRVAVAEPKIADVQVLGPRQVLVQGKHVGSTDLLMWGEEDRVWRARMDVEADLEALTGDLDRIFGAETLKLDQTGDVVVVRGSFSQTEQADRLRQLMEAHQIKYVDMTDVAGVHQVLLQVRVAEVSRTAIRALGVNGLFTGSDFFGGQTIGPFGGAPLNPVSIGPLQGSPASLGLSAAAFTSDVSVSPSVTVFGGFPDADFQFFVQALAENQYLRVLAEPNLVALSGEEAQFLAGGEYPIPVVQGVTAGGGTAISIEYREYGVRLKFRPTVLGDGKIRLKVAPEVSELSEQGAVEIQGFRIPAIITRRAQTTLELNNRQTFAIAGLISRSDQTRSSRIPGFGDVPILGALFRSVRYNRGETELLVMVTASLVEPLSADSTPPEPGVLHTVPNDWQLYALGRLHGDIPQRLAPADARWLSEEGLDRLRGPGAWARYEQPPARSQAVLCEPNCPPSPSREQER
jgi:pilus assembly protein CpaC